jgi:hypothetical protein
VSNGVFAEVKQFVEEVFSSGWAHILRLKRYAERQSSDGLEHDKTDIWGKKECTDCAESMERAIFSRRYGIEAFPCAHTALSYKKAALPRPPQVISSADFEDRTTHIYVVRSQREGCDFDSRLRTGTTPIPSFSDLPSDDDTGPDEYTRFIRCL